MHSLTRLEHRGRPSPSTTLISGMSLMALLEDHGRVATGYTVGDQRTEALLLCALVQERIADKRDERPGILLL